MKIFAIVCFTVVLLLASGCDGESNGSSTNNATPVARPTPLYVTPWDARTSKKVRNALGMSDGWTASEIKYRDAERARYEMRLAEWRKRSGVAPEVKQ